MNVLKKLASETALYGLSSIVGRFVYFLLVPLHTYIFDEPSLLADNSEMFLYSGLLSIIFVFGMETTFFRYATAPATRQHYFNLILSAIIVVGTSLSTVFIFFSTNFINLLGYPGKERLVVWMVLIVLMDAVSAIPFARLRMEGKARKFVRIRVTNILLNVFFNLFFIGFCRAVSAGRLWPAAQPFVDMVYNPALGPDYIIWANFLANLYLIWALRHEVADFKFTIDWQAFRPLLLYGLPLLLMGIAGNINQTADRFLFRHLLPDGFYEGITTDAAFGIYANCYKLAVLMAIVTQAFRYAADPFFFSKAQDKNSPQVFADVMKWFIIAGCIIWLGISLQLEWLVFFLGENYRVGSSVVPILALANLVIGIYWNLSIWFKLSDKTSYGTRLTLIGMTVSVLLNIWLIPRLGYMGSAVSFLTSSVTMAIFSYYWGQKYYPIPYKVNSAFLYVGLAAILVGIHAYIPPDLSAVATAFRFLLIIGYVGFVYLNEFKGKWVV